MNGTKSTLQVLATAAFAGIEIAVAENYTHYEDNKKPEFLSRFPHGKIPCVEFADGFRIFETSAIARYSKYLENDRGLTKAQR